MNGIKKKVLISINTSWNIFNFRRNLLQHLMDTGMSIIACAPGDSYSQKLIDLGIEFREIPMSQKGTNVLEDLKLLLAYRRIIKETKPDICLFYTIKPNIYGSLAAHLAGIPYINNISGLGTVFLRKRLSSSIAKLLYKLALKNSAQIFFQNQDDKKLFVDKGIIAHKKLKVLPGSGIDLNHFKSLKDKSSSKGFTFLMVSRLVFDKGVQEFIGAAEIVRKTYPNTIFEFLGKAEDEGNLGYSKNEMGQISKQKNIVWHSLKEDVRPYLENADVIVLPSYREGMSRALIEALAMEKAILTTDVPGCRELVNNEQNGLLCKAKNVNDLAEKMIKFIEIPEENIIRMGQNGRLFIKKSYSDEIIFESYLNAITDKLS